MSFKVAAEVVVKVPKPVYLETVNNFHEFSSVLKNFASEIMYQGWGTSFVLGGCLFQKMVKKNEDKQIRKMLENTIKYRENKNDSLKPLNLPNPSLPSQKIDNRPNNLTSPSGQKPLGHSSNSSSSASTAKSPDTPPLPPVKNFFTETPRNHEGFTQDLKKNFPAKIFSATTSKKF